jgi:hypothetical protein
MNNIRYKSTLVCILQQKGWSEELIEFDVIYFVQIIGEKPKIFAYITGDEQGASREKDLIP